MCQEIKTLPKGLQFPFTTLPICFNHICSVYLKDSKPAFLIWATQPECSQQNNSQSAKWHLCCPEKIAMCPLLDKRVRCSRQDQTCCVSGQPGLTASIEHNKKWWINILLLCQRPESFQVRTLLNESSESLHYYLIFRNNDYVRCCHSFSPMSVNIFSHQGD